MLKINNITLNSSNSYNSSLVYNINPETYKKQKLPTGAWLVEFECKAASEDEAQNIMLADAAARYNYLFSGKVEEEYNSFYCRYVGSDKYVGSNKEETEAINLTIENLENIKAIEFRRNIVVPPATQAEEYKIINTALVYSWFNLHQINDNYDLEIKGDKLIVIR